MLRTRICILAALLSVLAASPVLALEAASPAGDKATSAPVRKAASTATSAPPTSARGRVVIIRGNEESAAARERLMQIMLDNIKAFLDEKPINSVIK